MDTYTAVRDALVCARDNPKPRIDVSTPPISPKHHNNNSPLTPHTAEHGLGATGAVPILADIWVRHAPTSWTRVAASTTPVGATMHVVATLACQMAEDRLLMRLPHGPTPNVLPNR